MGAHVKGGMFTAIFMKISLLLLNNTICPHVRFNGSILGTGPIGAKRSRLQTAGAQSFGSVVELRLFAFLQRGARNTRTRKKKRLSEADRGFLTSTRSKSGWVEMICSARVVSSFQRRRLEED